MEDKFCEFCDSKGVRHKKECTRPQESEVEEPKKTVFKVYSPNGFVREYSVEIHGENAEEIAKGFAGKYRGYTVL